MTGKVETTSSNFYIADATILILYVVWSYVFERWKAVRWLHQTGFAMLAGMVAGAMFQVASHTSEVLSTEVILYALLPCIMLDAGYNLNVKEIYRYAGYVLLLGFLGSILMFVMLYACFQHLAFTGLKGSYSVSPRHRMYLAMVLTASDTVAPLALLPRAQHQRLHSIVFGEAIMNDVVVLFLSTAVGKLREPNLLELFVKSLWDIAASTAMGVFCGIAMSWGLGSFRQMIKEGPVERPAALILLSCYIAYGFAEKMALSGVMVMLITAIVLKFATREILNTQVDEFLTGITRTAGYMSESFMYGYFGLTFIQLISNSALEPPSPYFLAMSACSIVVCRIPIILFVRGLAEVFARRSRRRSLEGQPPGSSHRWEALPALSFRDTVLVGFCGTIRGVLAVVLIIRVLPKAEERSHEDTFCLQAVLTLVVVNVLAAGPLITMLKRVLRITPDEDQCAVTDNSAFALAAIKFAHEGVEMMKEKSYDSGTLEEGAQAGAAGSTSSPRRCSSEPAGAIEIELGTISRPATQIDGKNDDPPPVF